MQYNQEQNNRWGQSTQNRIKQSQQYNNSSQTKSIIYNQELIKQQQRKTTLRNEQYKNEILQAKQRYQQKQQEKQISESEKLKTENFILKQFQNIPSRYMSSSENYPQKNNVQKSNLTNSQIIKRRQSRQEIEQIPIKPIQRKQENPTDKPWRQQPIQKKQEQQVDYVKKNYQELKQMEKTIRQNKEKQQFQQDNYQYGQVPEYIVQLKQQLAEQKLKQQQQKQYDELMKNVPKGCRLVPDDERQDLLQQLKQALNEEYKKYNSFPLRYDNTSIQQAKNECGQKIDELEQTIVQFERKGPLYIKI